MTEELLLCKNCKWCKKPNFFDFIVGLQEQCRHPKVTGDYVTATSTRRCSGARQLRGVDCGTEGKYWEKKK